jgi:hypothetical protein
MGYGVRGRAVPERGALGRVLLRSTVERIQNKVLNYCLKGMFPKHLYDARSFRRTVSGKIPVEQCPHGPPSVSAPLLEFASSIQPENGDRCFPSRGERDILACLVDERQVFVRQVVNWTQQ